MGRKKTPKLKTKDLLTLRRKQMKKVRLPKCSQNVQSGTVPSSLPQNKKTMESSTYIDMGASSGKSNTQHDSRFDTTSSSNCTQKNMTVESPTYANLDNCTWLQNTNQDFAYSSTNAPSNTNNNMESDDCGNRCDIHNQTDSDSPYETSAAPLDNHISVATGHRIVDIQLFYTNLVQAANHSSLFQCGLNTMYIEHENNNGLESTFLLICKLCGKKNIIKNSACNLNKMAVEGTLAAGCGARQLNQIIAAIDLPSISDRKYRAIQDLVFDEWEVTAWEEMRKAGEREKEAAIKEGRLSKDGIPIIDVILDGCWSKRSYRTNYAASSGAAAIIGRKYGQVLYMAVKNKYCCICARAHHRKDTPKQHICYKNYSGPSTAMESSIISEGFKVSIDMHGLIYGRFIADGDSSTYSKILELRPYPGLTVEKIGCRNHILRNFCNKLQLLRSDTKVKIVERKCLTNDKILRARKYICDAIKYQGSADGDKSVRIRHLHDDILNCMRHAFGDHEKCNRIICQRETETTMPSTYYNGQVWQNLQNIVRTLASQVRSLIENVDSNVVERFNGVVAKFVGGKRVNYSLKRSYQARCSGAVISFNSGKILTTVSQNIQCSSPLPKIAKYEESIEQKRKINNKSTKKRYRVGDKKVSDSNYGENATNPDMDPNTYALSKAAFLKNLQKSEIERSNIERRTILQSECGEWMELRRNLLTASNFGKIIKRRKTLSSANLIKNLLYKPSIDHVASISHGKKYEKVALEELSNMMNLDIQECGLYIDAEHQFLGATPDGITEDFLIEIKCPVAPFKIGIEEAIKQGKMHFWRFNKKSKEISVNKNSDWYYQVQGQMHICKKSQCLLAVWYGHTKIKYEIIKKDEEFWKKQMEPILIEFYVNDLLPELIDPRFTRNMPIRSGINEIKVDGNKKKQNDENILNFDKF